MKSFVLTLVLTLFVFTSRAHALFGHVAVEHERRMEVEHQLATAQTQVASQQNITSRWQITSFILGIGCTGGLVIGAAIGSRGRKHAQ